jgi:hypothetical protein
MQFGTNVYNFTQYGNDLPGLVEFVRKVRQAARDAGRDLAAIGMDVSLLVEDKSRATLLDEIKGFAELGATHINAYFPPSSARAEIEAMKRFREVMEASAHLL